MTDYDEMQKYAHASAQDQPSTLTPTFGILRNPPVRKIVEDQIAEFEKMISVRKDLLKKLDENKGVEETLDLLRKIGI